MDRKLIGNGLRMNQRRRQKATREVGSIFKLENTRLLPLKGADEPIYYTGKKTKNETKKTLDIYSLYLARQILSMESMG